jgi:hypothetical protein
MEESTKVPAHDVQGRHAAGRSSKNLDKDEQMAISGKATRPICAESGVVPTTGFALST